jgi:hypothetical protein
MLREFAIWISETLFYLSGGVPLIAMPWALLLWGSCCVAVMGIPTFYAFHYAQRSGSYLRSLLITLFALAMFLTGMTIAISPGAIQADMLSECESVDVTVTTDLVSEQTVTMRQCRSKDNYYDEFGEWTIH